MSALLMGYDIEANDAHGTRAFIEAVRAIHRRIECPFTLFCVGQTVELQPKYFEELSRDPLIDIESHTYSHVLLKTVCILGSRGRKVHSGRCIFPGANNEQIDEEIAKANRILEPLIGRKVEGLTTPWGYYRGLSDRPDLLGICARHGIKFIRSWARDPLDGQPTPYQEPFYYSDQGYPNILECFIHGYQDDFYYYGYCEHPHADGFKGYLMDQALRIQNENLTWSACSHDHVKNEQDLKKKLSWLEPFLAAAHAAGVEGLDYKRYYERRQVTVS